MINSIKIKRITQCFISRSVIDIENISKEIIAIYRLLILRFLGLKNM